MLVSVFAGKWTQKSLLYCSRDPLRSCDVADGSWLLEMLVALLALCTGTATCASASAKVRAERSLCVGSRSSTCIFRSRLRRHTDRTWSKELLVCTEKGGAVFFAIARFVMQVHGYARPMRRLTQRGLAQLWRTRPSNQARTGLS